ncbi:hypothetical protein Cva_00866 [Caedimonas varicaedens]|jgi:hypothetical protein|uniref:Uncharacterized protein n=1 Tax=Caedimonas varicaedens TaxID=1629334 RepID=A0A0K8MDB5_9PROT|nr:hypothetical protein Cva_00866 [Caedimonas varicaedens]
MMVAPVIAAAVALAEMTPLISKWLSNSEESVVGTQKIAQQVVELAKKVTHADHPMAAVQALTDDPKLFIQYQQALTTMNHEIERSYLQDRINSRDRDAALIAAGRSNTRADIMVMSAAAGLLFCLIALGYYQGELPGEAVGIISTIAGIFGACLKDAYAFEFGSSRGSKNKDLVSLLGTRGNHSL